VPDFPVLKKTADALNVKTKVNLLIHSKVVQEFIGIEIRKSLKGKYGGYEIPKKFMFIDENFTIENGMLTQTLKLKRRLVIEKYKEQIENLFR
jgi:long-chain acyl-CoA synthetase